ncbi:MAG: hypothetical protein ACRDGT_06695 [Candidatus Limnocylindria bacterium]
MRTPLGVAVLSAGIVLGLALALWPITPRIAFNDGLGYDGIYYAGMVRAMRDGAGAVPAERPHYAYRPLPMAVVAATAPGTNAEIARAFLAMNLVSLVLAGALLGSTVHRVAGGVLLPAVAVLWFAALPGSVRWAMYYPVLVDGIGLLLLFALVFTVAARMPLLFTILIGPAMLARENVVVLVPMLWLALLPGGVRRASLWSAVAGAVALAAYAWVRVAPPVPPAQPFDALFEARQNLEWFFTTSRAERFAAAWPLALGLFALVPLVAWRAGAAFLRRELAWLYYLVSTVALIVVIGGDYDRYFLYLVPVLAVLAFGAAPHLWRSPAVLALVTGLHLLVARFAWPVGTSEAAYLRYGVATMDLASLHALLAAATIVAAIAAAVMILVSRPRGSATAQVPSS